PMTAGRVNQPVEAMERAPGAFWRAKARGIGARRTKVPCPSFLVHHPTAGKVLIDTALHASIADDPRHNFGTLLARFLPPEIEPGEDIAAQLRRKEVDPRQIRVVVMTHLHIDHASAISEFPDSMFVLSRAEWEDATQPSRPIFRGYRPVQYDFPFDYQTIDFEAEDKQAPIESYGSFARTFDLFGDGSIRLAYTPGHSAGHMSVVLRLPRRDFVVGGDVVYTFNQLEGGPPQPLPRDQHNWRRSLKELQLFHRDNPYAIITPGHEAEFYEQLEDRYEE
ncbi:MAG: N-acyl homoserine lactonase family protein, partial [Solirubrobacterales bacterium]